MKRKYIGISAAIVVVAVVVVLLAPPIMRFKSYDGFVGTVLKVKNLQIKGFDIEPEQGQFAGGIYVMAATDPAKIARNTDISKYSAELVKYNILPLSSFGFIHAKKYFLQKYLLEPIGVNGVECFGEEFLLRFYDSSSHVLTMVVMEYAPEINRKMLLSQIFSPTELGIDDISDSPPNDDFRSQVLKHLGGNKLNADVLLTTYSGRHFIASIFDFSPKTDNTEERARICAASDAFELGLLKTLYGN